MFFQATKKMFIIVTLLASTNTLAKEVASCLPADKVLVNTSDEACEHLSQAALDCFLSINKSFEETLVFNKKNNLEKEELATVIENYEEAIQNLGNYYSHMPKGLCLNQRKEVEVTIEELEKDLKTLTKIKKK